jgi:hypothetical protein
MIERAGHWMWLDRPDVIDKAAEVLHARPGGAATSA